MQYVLRILAVFFIVATVLPLWKHEAWWVRVFDFPRAQIAAGGLLISILYLAFQDVRSIAEGVLLAALVSCALYQSAKMLPYSVAYPRQVKVASDDRPDDRFSALIANVLMENREAPAFLEIVKSRDPDLVLTLETDDWWSAQLAPLDDDYPHSVRVPLPNTYGMILHSRLELVDPVVEYLIDEEIPSIHAGVRLPGGQSIRLHALHPKPPAPTEDTDTVDRDAELLVIGKTVREHGGPTIVMGDLNDVAWSHSTRLFQKVSGLMDPRIGRGMYSTYHAGNPLLRWPLDHLFHSDHFELVRIERLPAWGSDHFPIYVELQYAPEAATEQEAPTADPKAQQEAREKIDKAHDGE